MHATNRHTVPSSRRLSLLLAIAGWLAWGGATALAQYVSTFKDFYPDSTLKREYRGYIDGGFIVKHGLYTSYYAGNTGKKWEEGSYEHGLRQGLWRMWNEAGVKTSEGGYDLGLEDGAWSFWFDSGRLSNTGPYATGKQHGLWTYWTDTRGLKYQEQQFNTGNLIMRNYYGHHANGVMSLWEHTEWRNGDTFLTTTTYYENGRMQGIENKKNDVLHGLVVNYYEDGVKKSEATYDEGWVVGPCNEWYPSGRLRSSYSGVKGSLAATFMSWHENGERQSQISSNAGGKPIGWSYEWYTNGLVARQVPYIDGVETGLRTEWQYRFQHLNEWYWEKILWERWSGPVESGTQYGSWVRTTCYTDDEGTAHTQRFEQNRGPRPRAWPPYEPGTDLFREVRGYITQGDTRTPLANATVQVGLVTTNCDDRGFYRAELYAEDFSQPVTVTARFSGFLPAATTVDLGKLQYAVANLTLQPLPLEQTGTPQITDIVSQFGRYYINGVAVENTYAVKVDWKGLEPGSLLVNVNGTARSVPATDEGGRFTLDMGHDFRPSVDPMANQLMVIAQNQAGAQSPVWVLHPVVMPAPGWLVEAAWPIVVAYQYWDRAPTYAFTGSFPEPPLQLKLQDKMPTSVWDVWSKIPYIGGIYEIKETQVFGAFEYKTDNTGSFQVGGQTGFTLAGKELVGKAKGSAKVKFEPGTGMTWAASEVYLGAEGKIEDEIGIAKLVPGVVAVTKVPVIGRLLESWLDKAKAKTAFTGTVGANFEVASTNKPYWIKTIKPEFGGGVALTLYADVGGGASTELTGGGSVKVVSVLYPPKDLGFEKVEGEFSAKAGFTWKLLKLEPIEAKFTVAWPAPSNSLESLSFAQERAVLAAAPAARVTPITREFLSRQPYSRVPAGAAAPLVTLTADSRPAPTSQLLVQNVYPYAEPALVTRGSRAIILQVYFDPNDPAMQETEITAMSAGDDFIAWPTMAANDTRAEFNPTLVTEPIGGVFCAWERIKDDAFTGTTIEELAARLEIVWAYYYPPSGAWVQPVALTDNDYLDHSPVLRRGFDGSVILAWQSNPANELVGTTNAPSRFHFTKWDGVAGAFAPVGTLPQALTNVLTTSLGYDGVEARLVYDRDMDGNLSTSDDVELFEQRYDGTTWSAPRRLTDNTVADANPHVLYRAVGAPELIWQQGSNLVRMADWSTATAAVARPRGGSFALGDYQVATDGQGHIVVLWQGSDEQGPDVFYSVYDTALDIWSRDLRLTRDAAVEQALSFDIADDATLNVACIKKTPGSEVTDLYRVTYTLRTDLAVASNGVSALPASPLPGQAVTLSCRVENAGDLPVGNATVSFYADAPGSGGPLLGSAPLVPSPLCGGDAAEASLAWTLPADGSVQIVHAVVDPDNSVAESDEANNTGSLAFRLDDVQALLVRVEEHGDGQVDLIARLRNNGIRVATNVTVAFRGDGNRLATTTVAAMLPGRDVEILHTDWDAIAFTNLPSWVEAVADPDNLLAETNEANNAAAAHVHLAADADNDRLPDQWERYHFQTTANDGAGDQDGDGATEEEEYRTGTNPTDPSSVLRNSLAQPDGAGNVTITWPAEPGLTYQAEYAETLTPPHWRNVGAAITATNTLGTARDTPPAGAMTRFYRVRVVNPPTGL